TADARRKHGRRTADARRKHGRRTADARGRRTEDARQTHGGRTVVRMSCAVPLNKPKPDLKSNSNDARRTHCCAPSVHGCTEDARPCVCRAWHSPTLFAQQLAEVIGFPTSPSPDLYSHRETSRRRPRFFIPLHFVRRSMMGKEAWQDAAVGVPCSYICSTETRFKLK
ncbi:hypothetical protein LINGRAHAP2_LOCUS3361, partial [Linum grandiflorum]